MICRGYTVTYILCLCCYENDGYDHVFIIVLLLFIYFFINYFSLQGKCWSYSERSFTTCQVDDNLVYSLLFLYNWLFWRGKRKKYKEELCIICLVYVYKYICIFFWQLLYLPAPLLIISRANISQMKRKNSVMRNVYMQEL